MESEKPSPEPEKKKQKLSSEDDMIPPESEPDSDCDSLSTHESDSRKGDALLPEGDLDKYPITLQRNHLHYNSESSLVVKDLQSWMGHGYLEGCFSHLGIGKVLRAKIIKKSSSENNHDGQGIIEFKSKKDAEDVLAQFDGTGMPNTTQMFKLSRMTDA